MLISHINNHKPSSIILSFTVVLATLAAVLSMPRVEADESERHKIHYLLTPGPPSVPNSMHVTLTIPTLSPNEASSCIGLQLPPSTFGIAGVDGPYHNITRDSEVSYGWRVEGGETTSTGGGTWHLCSTRKKEERDVAQFGYTISQGSGGPLQGGGYGPPVDRVKVLSPLFQPDYWTFTSVTGLVVPELSGAVRVIVAAEAPGSNWKLLSSRGIDLSCERQDNENTHCQISFDVDDVTRDLRRWADTQPAAAVGESTLFHFAKNVHIHRFTLPRRSGGPLNSVDNEVIIAITGETDYATIQELQEGTQRIVEGCQAYWRGAPHDFFLINIIAFSNQEPNNVGGNGIHRGLNAMIPQRDMKSEYNTNPVWAEEHGWPLINKEEILSFLAHEYSHYWYSGSMMDVPAWEQDIVQYGISDDAGAGKAVPAMLFTEGFATYLQDLMLLTSGELNLQRFADRINAQLTRLYDVYADQLQAGIKGIGDNFSLTSYQKQPYLRGVVLLLNWNARMVLAGQESGNDPQNINNLMWAIVKEFNSHELGGNGNKLSLATIQELSLQFLPEGIQPDVDRYFLSQTPERLEPHPLSLGRCFDLQTEPFYQYIPNAEFKARGAEKCAEWLTRLWPH